MIKKYFILTTLLCFLQFEISAQPEIIKPIANQTTNHKIKNEIFELKKEYDVIIKNIQNDTSINNTYKNLILNFFSIAQLHAIPAGMDVDFYKAASFYKSGFFLLYPILKKRFYNNEFTKNLKSLKDFTQKAKILHDSGHEKEIQKIATSFKILDEKMISDKFSNLNIISFLSDIMILLEGGKSLFLTSLYFLLNQDWTKTCQTDYLKISTGSKFYFILITTFMYYMYCKLICKDFFNSKNASLFEKIQTLMHSVTSSRE